MSRISERHRLVAVTNPSFIAVGLALLVTLLLGVILAHQESQDTQEVTLEIGVRDASWHHEGNANATHQDGESPDLPTDDLPADFDWQTIPLGMPENRPIPEGSPLNDKTITLGRKLFFDARLSRDESVSCASCHRPELAFATNDPVAIGIDGTKGTRNAPTLLNVAYGTSFFWDGRAATLEEQALQPIENPIEMDFSVDGVLERLKEDASYQEAFKAAFVDGITRENLAIALASFQRALVTGNSPVDRFRAAEFSALTNEQRSGMWIFESRGGCWRCHGGSNFNDELFHNTGVSWGAASGDTGKHMITGKETDRGMFRTPTLRQVAHTAPYMHDGSLKTLREVVEFYNKGGGKNPNLDPLVKPLELTDEEVGFLVAFLEALSSDSVGMNSESQGE